MHINANINMYKHVNVSMYRSKSSRKPKSLQKQSHRAAKRGVALLLDTLNHQLVAIVDAGDAAHGEEQEMGQVGVHVVVLDFRV